MKSNITTSYRSHLRSFGHVIRMLPAALLEIFQTCLTRKKLVGKAKTHWRNYMHIISGLWMIGDPIDRVGGHDWVKGHPLTQPWICVLKWWMEDVLSLPLLSPKYWMKRQNSWAMLQGYSNRKCIWWVYYFHTKALEVTSSSWTHNGSCYPVQHRWWSMTHRDKLYIRSWIRRQYLWEGWKHCCFCSLHALLIFPFLVQVSPHAAVLSVSQGLSVRRGFVTTTV